jgi:glycosyltransferase involved in cell wall biosynthesis
MPPLPGLRAALQHQVPAADLVQAVDSSWDGPFIAAFEAAKRCSKPFVAIPLMHLTTPDVTARYDMPHQRQVYREADAVVALSQHEVDALRAWDVRAEVCRLAMGIDTDLPVAEAELRPDTFLQEHDITAPLVAFVGATTYDKGAFDLAQAVVELNMKGRPVYLVCAGPQRELLAGFIARQTGPWQAVAGRHIRLLGVVDEMTKHRLLEACSFLALPSRVDAFGIVLLEAWLHRKAVIGADAGGIPDVVSARKTGVLVPFGDVEGLRQAISLLIADPQLACRLGSAGFEQLQSHTWDLTYRHLLQIHASVLRQGCS